MLETLEFFSSLSNAEIQEISKIARRSEFRRNEVIFNQGDASRELYLIESGMVEISIKDIFQETKTLARLKNGEVFGEMAIFDPNSIRSATARAVQNSVIIIIPGVEFEGLLKARPGISFKLLGTLSKRLREANERPTKPANLNPPGKIITIAGPRNGIGKTTLATTMANILDQEVRARTLFIDLDLPYADGTYFMGVHSVRTIIEFCSVASGKFEDFDSVKRHLAHVGNNLYCLAGPVNIVDGERLDSKTLITGIRILQRFFDYVVIDTDCRLDEIFLAALDLSDKTFFLVDGRSPYSVKITNRYFYGLGKLNLATDRLTIIANPGSEPGNVKGLSTLLQLPVYGVAPLISEHQPQYGASLLASQDGIPYCQFVRQLLKTFFPIEIRAGKDQGFFSRLFAKGGEKDVGTVIVPEIKTKTEAPVTFRDANFRALLRSIRTGLVAGLLDEARNSIIKLVEMSGPSAAVYQTFGEILLQEGKTSEAIDVFKKAINLEPDCHLALGYAGIISLDQKMFMQAVDILQKKIAKSPKWPDLQRDLGELYLRHDDLKEALPHFLEALKLNPKYEDARVRLAELYFRMGKFENAITELMKMTQKTAPAFYLMGKCFHAVDRLTEALESFRSVLRICPSYLDTNERIADLQVFFGKVNNLIEMHQKIRIGNPEYLDIRIKLAQLFATAGRRKEAENECLDALKIKPNYKLAQDLLDRFKNQTEYIIDRPEKPDHPKHPCHGTPCPGFHIGLQLGEQALDPLLQERMANHVFWFRNVRTGKSFEFRVPPTLNSKLDIIAQPLCPITENDVLQISFMNPQTGHTLFTEAKTITETGEPLCKIAIDLSDSLRQITQEIPLITPIKHFMLSVPKQALSAGEESILTYDLVNPRNGLKGVCYSDSDQKDQVCFVLSTTENMDVVRVGDVLQIQYSLGDGKIAVKARVKVTPDDVAAYSRIIQPGAIEGLEVIN